MTTQTQTGKGITIEVEYEETADWMGSDTEGVDIEASVSRITDLAEAALVAAYPEASISVGVTPHGTFAHPLQVTDTDGCQADDVRDSVAAILDGVFNCGDWLVLLDQDAIDAEHDAVWVLQHPE